MYRKSVTVIKIDVLDLSLCVQKHLVFLKITNYEIEDSRTPKKE
jgi:hypothetical protein